MPNRLIVGAWKKLDGPGWNRVSVISKWTSVSLESRFNAPGPWSLQIPVGAQVFELTKKHLLTFDLQSADIEDGPWTPRGRRYTAAIENFELDSDTDTGKPVLTVSGLDAMSWLGDALGWPTPANDIDNQTDVRWYATGVAETVLGNLVRANLAARLGYEINVPDSQGRGAVVTVNSTFTNILQLVQDTLKDEDVNLGVRLGLVNTTSSTRAEMTLEFYIPDDKSQRVKLAQGLGMVSTWKQTEQIPSATRVIVQGAKEKDGFDIDSVSLSANTITTVPKRKVQHTRDVDHVSAASNSITTKSGHDLGKGDRISFGGSGNPPAPLEDGVDYYAIRVDANTLKVAATRDDANHGNAIGFQNNGSGSLTVQRIKVSTQDNKLRTGDIVTFSGGTPPAPLDADTPYVAIRVDDDTFRVAYTRRLASQKEAIDLTAVPAGTVTVTEEKIRYREVISGVGEAEWGRMRESYSPGAGDDNNDALDMAGLESLGGSASQTGFEISVTEAKGLRYGQHFDVGDLVTLIPAVGAERVDHLGAARITGTSSDGLAVTLLPGNPDATNKTFQYAAIIRGLRRKANQVQED